MYSLCNISGEWTKGDFFFPLPFLSFKLWKYSNTFTGDLENTEQSCTWSKSEVAQSCLTLCDCSPPGFSVHGIFQARLLDWVAVFFSRGSSQPRDQTHVSHIAGRLFTLWATRESHHIGWPLCYTNVLFPLLLKKENRDTIDFLSLLCSIVGRFFFFLIEV